MARGPLAGASGPGKFSKRTDLPSAYYGEGVETAAIKSGAPLATTPDVRPSQAPAVPAQEPITPLFAPTQRPDEPITAGIDRGPGAGSSALMMKKSVTKTSDTLAKMLPYDTDGSIAILYQQAVARGD
jgi:hypothetical protein